MKIKVNLDRFTDCLRIVVTIIDTEKLFSNKLFQSPLDYPSNEMWSFVKDEDNINWIENIFFDEDKAKIWADMEIKCLKNKLHI